MAGLDGLTLSLKRSSFISHWSSVVGHLPEVVNLNIFSKLLQGRFLFCFVCILQWCSYSM